MHAVLTRVDVFSCHVSCCVVGKIRREEHILVRIFYTVRVETHTGREMMVDGRLSYGGIYSCAKTEYNHVMILLWATRSFNIFKSTAFFECFTTPERQETVMVWCVWYDALLLPCPLRLTTTRKLEFSSWLHTMIIARARRYLHKTR